MELISCLPELIGLREIGKKGVDLIYKRENLRERFRKSAIVMHNTEPRSNRNQRNGPI